MFENLDNKFACNEAPCVNCENRSAAVLSNKKLAYIIEDPKRKARMISLKKPNPFLIIFARNIYKKSTADLELEILRLSILNLLPQSDNTSIL